MRNATEEPVRILMLSTRIAPEILVYPDSDKVLTKDAKDDDIFQKECRLGERSRMSSERGQQIGAP